MSARIATERVYRTLDGRYVPHGHEDAAFLVVGVGGPLPATVSDSGRSPLPFAVAFAVTVLLALLIRRLRRHDDE